MQQMLQGEHSTCTDFYTVLMKTVITNIQALHVKKEKEAENGRPRDPYFDPLQKSRWYPNPLRLINFFKVFTAQYSYIPTKYLQEHATICMPAGKIQMLDSWSLVTLSLLLSLGILPFFKAFSMHRNCTFQSGCTYQYDGDVIFPLLKWSVKPDILHLIQADSSQICKCIFWETPWRNPGAVFDFTIQNNPLHIVLNNVII